MACLGLAWVFVKLASDVLDGELITLDRAVQRWMAAYRSPAGVALFSAVTLLGAKELLAPVGALAGWWLFRGPKRLAVLIAFTALAVAEFAGVLKRNFQLPRPLGEHTASMGYGFPSGHATGAIAVAIVFSFVSVRRNAHPRIIVPVCLATALLIGVSRVYLDVHWASDVIGGWLVGATFGVGCCAIYELMYRSALRATATATTHPNSTDPPE